MNVALRQIMQNRIHAWDKYDEIVGSNGDFNLSHNYRGGLGALFFRCSSKNARASASVSTNATGLCFDARRMRTARTKRFIITRLVNDAPNIAEPARAVCASWFASAIARRASGLIEPILAMSASQKMDLPVRCARAWMASICTRISCPETSPSMRTT